MGEPEILAVLLYICLIYEPTTMLYESSAQLNFDTEAPEQQLFIKILIY